MQRLSVILNGLPVDAMVEDCRRMVSIKGAGLECFGLTQETVVEL